MDIGLILLIGIPTLVAIWAGVVLIRRERVNRRLAKAYDFHAEEHHEDMDARAAAHAAQMSRGMGGIPF